MNLPMRSTVRRCAALSRHVVGVTLTLVAILVASGCASVAQTGTPTVSTSGDSASSEGVREFEKDDLYRLLVAEIAAQRGELDLAVDNYLVVAERSRDAGVAERAVRQAMYTGNEAKSLKAARLWTQIAPDDPTARQVFGALLMRVGQTDRAVEQFEQLLSHNEGEEGFDMMSELLSRERDRDTAYLTMGRLAQNRTTNPHALYAYARMAARAGELDRAAETLEDLLAIDPEHERGAVFYARVLQQKGNISEALDSLSATLEKKPESKAVRMTFARLLVDARRYEAARDQFEILTEVAPDDTDVRYALGLLLLQTNRYEEARVHFEKLIVTSELRGVAYYYLGQISERVQEPLRALEYYRRVDRSEHYLDAQIRVSIILADEGDVDEARAHLHSIIRRNPQQDVQIYRAEAEILVKIDRPLDAMSVYDQALAEHNDDIDLLYARAMLAEKLDRLDILETDLRRVLATDPNNSDALNALGFTLADRTERFDEAIGLIQRAIDLRPDDFYIIDSMGWVLYRVGRHAEALEHLRRAYELSEDAEVAAHLGEVLWVSGDRAAAREVWETALKTTPEDEKLLEVIERFAR